jgi:hypothetical protein
MNIDILKRILFCIVLLCAMKAAGYAQGAMQDLGSVWEKTYGTGHFYNIKAANSGGTYIAAGKTWHSASPVAKKKEGLIIEFNESGAELFRKEVTPDLTQLEYNQSNTTGIEAHFRFAFKTEDGYYIAFGQITDSKAPEAYTEYNWDLNKRGPDLTKGVWIVTISPNGTVIQNDIVLGSYPADGVYTGNATNTTDQYIVVGCDRSENPGSGNSDDTKIGITMIRRYTYDTSTHKVECPIAGHHRYEYEDKRNNFIQIINSGNKEYYGPIATITKSPHNSDYILIGTDFMFKIRIEIFDYSASTLRPNPNIKPDQDFFIEYFPKLSISKMLAALKIAGNSVNLPSAYSHYRDALQLINSGAPGGYSISPGADEENFYIASRLDNGNYYKGSALFQFDTRMGNSLNSGYGPKWSFLVFRPVVSGQMTSDIMYHAPFLLQKATGAPANKHYYFGAKRALYNIPKNGISGNKLGDFDNERDTFYMYGMTSETFTRQPEFPGNSMLTSMTETERANPNVLQGPVFPLNTAPRMAGLMDGFFASGTTNQTNNDGVTGANQASIAKLSTCARFKLVKNVNDADKMSFGGNIITVPQRTLNIANPNDISRVKVTCTVTNMAPGNTNTTWTTIPSQLTVTQSNKTVTVPAATVTLNGDNYAILRYTIVAVDESTYCQSTYEYMVFIAGLALQKYYACPDARVIMKLGPTNGVTYTWYKTETGSDLVPFINGNNGDPLNLNGIADSAIVRQAPTNYPPINPNLPDKTPVIETVGLSNLEWYVEPYIQDNAWKFPRIKIEVIKPIYCDGLVDDECVKHGELLFKEDFGGNISTSSQNGGARSDVTYRYDTNLMGHGVYTITQQNPGTYTAWHRHYDHTIPGRKPGYFLAADASDDPGQFFRKEITDLCPGTSLYFTAWIINLCHTNPGGDLDKPMLQFVIEDTKGNTLAKYYTGPIDADPKPNQWKQYGFNFDIPPGQKNVVLRILNAGETSNNGNDFGLDDIEIRLCGRPSVDINDMQSKTDTLICQGTTISLKGKFDNSNTVKFNSTVYGQWFYKDIAGDPNSNSGWTAKGNRFDFTAPTGIYNTQNYPDPAGEGYYMLVIDTQNDPKPNSKCSARKYIAVRYKDCLNLLPDSATVQKYHSVNINLLKNDVLDANFFPRANFSLKALVTAQPTAGTLHNTANDSIITYVSHSPKTTSGQQIDEFTYEITDGGLTKSTTVSIYILNDTAGAVACPSDPYIPRLEAEHPGTTFSWSPALNPNAVSATYKVTPTLKTTPQKTFPPGDFHFIRVDNSLAVDMQWTGAVDSVWQNPGNWIVVKNNQGYPAEYAPARCTNVTIPTIVERFPDLIDSAYCAQITMKDRALLKNPHVLVHDKAVVEIKLRPTSERDRFIMWSAPLKGMKSGDYHLHNGNSEKSDVFISLFQQNNPDKAPTSTAKISELTSTFANMNQDLGLGRAFNLKLIHTQANRDAIYIFNKGTKFITDGMAETSKGSRRYTLPVESGAGLTGVTLMQVVNPYMAYLNFSQFHSANTDIQNGYYTWDGNPKSGFKVSVNLGNRYETTTSNPFKQSSGLIPPLQSFFVVTSTGHKDLTISPDFTTVSQEEPYTLRSSVTAGGILHITVSQEDMQAYAALLYSPKATSLMDKEDMPAIFYSDLPLAVYTYSARNEPLAINANGYFNMEPVKLGLMAVKKGDVTLTFTDQETFGHSVVLVDHILNKRIDINTTPSYTFSAEKAGAINERFTLELTYTGYGLNRTSVTDAAYDPSFTINTIEAGIILHSTGAPIQSVEVHDILSRPVYSEENINGSEHFISLPPSRIYIVTIKAGEKRIVRKIKTK